jgi:hypothetical protein
VTPIIVPHGEQAHQTTRAPERGVTRAGAGRHRVSNSMVKNSATGSFGALAAALIIEVV